MRDKERYVYIATLVFVLIGGLVIGKGLEWVWAAAELVPYSVFNIPQLPLTGVLGFCGRGYWWIGSREEPNNKDARCRGRGRVIPRDLASA